MTSDPSSLPPGWAQAALGTIADIRLGKMLSPKAYAPDLAQLPYLRNENVRWGSIDFDDVKMMGFHAGELDRYGVQPMDLLVCEGGQPGRCAVYKGEPGRFMYQKALHRVRPYGGIRPELIQYCLEHYVRSGVGLPRTSETTIQHLPLEKMYALQMRLPPLDEQRRIIETIEEQFTRLDAAVAGLKRVQQQLKRYRASVLKAACEGRLVPTEAELARAEGREYESADRLLERILEERRVRVGAKYKEPMAPSPAGSLPEGWTWATAEQLVYRSEYGTSVKCSHEAEGVPVLRIPNVAAGRISLDDVKFATIPLAIKDGDALEGGDVLMVRTNGSVSLVGRTAVVPNDVARRLYFASYLLRFRFAESATLPRWFSLYATSDQGRRFLERHAASSAGQHNVSLSLVHRWSVPLPPASEQERIVAEVERRLSVIEKAEAAVEANLKRAERMRQAILKRAFEGKLVPQDPNDEPACVLLERIRAEREQSAATAPKRRGRRSVVQAEQGGQERNGQLRLLDADAAVVAKQRVIRRDR